MIRKARCHCGTIQFEAELPDALIVSRCNCSICASKNVAMAYVPRTALKVTAGEDALSCYQFNTKVAKHYFCSKCGIQCFHQPRSDPDKFAINAATIEGVRIYEDFPEIAVFDGQNHSKDNGGQRFMAGIMRFEETPGKIWPEGVI